MATAQKKKPASHSSSGGKRVASSSGSSASKSGGSRSKTKRTAPKKKPFRREIGAVVCLLLAIFGAFGYFHVDALFIAFFHDLVCSLIGYGFWLVPPALLLASYILTFHRGRPVTARVTFALLLPVMFSCVVHGLLNDPIPWDRFAARSFLESGKALQSGGVICGILGQFGVQVFSSLGNTIIFAMGFILMGLGAFNRTLVDVADWVFNRPQYEYQEAPVRQRAPKEHKVRTPIEGTMPVHEQKAVSGTRQAHAEIDIPVDEGPLVGKKASIPVEKKKGSFFNRKPRVPAPDQLLTREQQAEPAPAAPEPAEAQNPVSVSVTPAHISSAAAEPSPESAAEPVSRPAPAPAEPVSEFRCESTPQPAPVYHAPVRHEIEEHEDTAEHYTETAVPEYSAAPACAAESAMVMPEITREPAVEKVSGEEARRSAIELAQEIQSNAAPQEIPYRYPPVSLLKESSGEIGGDALYELDANRQRLNDTIHSFGIDANIVDVVRGPSVTRYELELDQGVRLNKLTNLADDIALALGATGVRIAPIPDKISVVGIEVPNKVVSPVDIHSVIASNEFTHSKSKVSFAVGKDISGDCIVGDINKLPHLLIAGTTGSGKSVCTNSLIVSLLYKSTPEEVRLIMVDPKMVELGIYNGIPHLLIPVVTDPKKAAGALQWAVTEMMKRYRTFSEAGVRKLEEYNAYAVKNGQEKMPFIVVVIDELADLMLVAAKEVEESICRVAQMGRAAGMHLVIATQRPSADVITGLMKANIPSRIAFAVASAMESRIILDTQGAEKLVGRGDMLFAPLGSGKPTRVQGCFISDAEVANVVDFVKKNSGDAQYSDEVLHEIEKNVAGNEKGAKGVGGSAPDEANNEYDELIDAATEVILETGQASVSMLQRRLKLGYARAARLVDQLEEKGIVGPFEGSKPRQLLITKEQWQEMQYRSNMGNTGGYDAPSTPAAPDSMSPSVSVSEPVQQAVESPAYKEVPIYEMDGPNQNLDRSQEDTL